MKKIYVLFIAIFIFLSFSCHGTVKEVSDINIIVNSKKVYASLTIINSDSSILYPLRSICTLLNIPSEKVIWNDKEKSISIYNSSDETLTFDINSKNAKINSTEISLFSRPLLYKNSAYVPLRTLCDFLGFYIIWDSSTRSIFIKESSEFNQTKSFFNKVENKLSEVLFININVINEINTNETKFSFGNSIKIDRMKKQIYTKSLFDEKWKTLALNESKKIIPLENDFLIYFVCGMNFNKVLSDENFMVFEGYYPSSGNLCYGKVYVNTQTLLIEKLITEFNKDNQKILQNVLYNYLDNLT